MTMDTFLAWTNAPEAYDYSYVRDTGVTALSLDEATRYRLVEVTDLARWEACQIPRYASGWCVAFLAASHRALVEVGMGSESAMGLLQDGERV